MENTGGYRTDRYTINYYPAEGKSAYTLYEDNPASTSSLSDKSYRLMTFEGDSTHGRIDIKISATGDYPGSKDMKELTFVVHRVDFVPTSVTMDGRKIDNYTYDRSGKTLSFDIAFDSGKKATTDIRIR